MFSEASVSHSGHRGGLNTSKRAVRIILECFPVFTLPFQRKIFTYFSLGTVVHTPT